LAPDAGTVTPLAAVTYNIYMPSSFDKKEFAVFEMQHKVNEMSCVTDFTHEAAAEIVTNLADELNSLFMTELGDPVVAENDGESPPVDAEPNQFSNLRLIFIGGSHAYRMAAAAENLGLEIENLAEPGFRITDSSIESKVEQLRDVLETGDKRTVIVYHLYDNNVFFSGKPDGSRALPVKKDNVYHVEGRLEFADHHTIKHLVHASVPLLRAGGDNEKLILSPFLRYLKSCCKDKGHLTNRKDPDYFKELGSALHEMRESIKDTVYGKKIRSFKVLDPTCLLDKGDDDEATAVKLKLYLQDDPVHLNSEGYAEIVQGLLDNILGGSFTRAPNLLQTAAGAVKSAWRGKRRDWIDNDDTVAKRSYGGKWNQRARGYRGNLRGGFRGFGGGGGAGHSSRGRGIGGGKFGASGWKSHRGRAHHKKPY
jgi:hypothetical protein